MIAETKKNAYVTENMVTGLKKRICLNWATGHYTRGVVMKSK